MRWGNVRRCALAIVVVLGSLVAAVPPPAGAAGVVPTPVLTVPPAGLRGHALWDSYFDLAPFGYEEQELFVTGVARDFGGVPAAYTTRIIVTRPSDLSRFNGTVLLDWVNVTAQLEIPVDTMLAREMLLREGFAYVHVSAQSAGLCCVPQLTPKMWDPVRYAALNHPGDEWAFDMFTQVAQAFRTVPPAGGTDPMGALGVGSVQHVLAAGQSQSGIRLHDYLNSWLPSHPEAVGLIDGVLVHGDVLKSKTFDQPLPVPVLKLLSDSEATDDGVDPATLDPKERLWEIAGAAHADLFIGYQSIAGNGPRSTFDVAPVSKAEFQAIIEAAGNYGEQVSPLLAVCVAAGATMPMHYAASTAIHQLNRWVAGGTAPESGPRYQFAGGALAKDEDGNTLGGIRLPPIDVPVAQYQSTVCGLGGITVPFTDLQIQARYPTHATYYSLMAERADAAVSAGWLLPEDALDLMRRACAASNRWGAAAAPCPPYVPPPFDQPLPVGFHGSVGAPSPEATRVDGSGATLPVTGGQPALLALLVLAAAALVARRLLRLDRHGSS